MPGASHSAWRAAWLAPPGVGDAMGRAAPFAAPRAPLPYRLMAQRAGPGRFGRSAGSARSARAEQVLPELGQLVAQHGGLLELQVAGVFVHLFFQPLDLA